MVSGFLSCFELKLSLAELRSATGCLEAVLLSFFHTRVAGQVSGLLQNASELRIRLKQSSCNAVSDGACLSGISAALYIDKDIKQQGAFSYYYLCVRDSEKPAEAIGKTFAELCDRKGDCVYAKLGSALFEYFLAVVDDRVKALRFQE